MVTVTQINNWWHYVVVYARRCSYYNRPRVYAWRVYATSWMARNQSSFKLSENLKRTVNAREASSCQTGANNKDVYKRQRLSFPSSLTSSGCLRPDDVSDDDKLSRTIKILAVSKFIKEIILSLSNTRSNITFLSILYFQFYLFIIVSNFLIYLLTTHNKFHITGHLEYFLPNSMRLKLKLRLFALYFDFVSF